MELCPACGRTALVADLCRACGYRRVRRVQAPDADLALDEPEVLPLDALIIEADPESFEDQPLDLLEPEPEIEPMPGLEQTALEPHAIKPPPPPPKAPTAFVYSVCPGCQSEQPDPAPTFCETCGFRLRVARKTADEDKIRCGECGVRNSKDRSRCTNCGCRLRTD